MMATSTYMGIDVAKDCVDIGIRPSEECHQAESDEPS
jgi:hypothetical protein